jgi:nucleotide-binding universal stress UspA family protein
VVVHVAADEQGEARLVADAVGTAHATAPELEVHGRQTRGDPADVLVELSAQAHLLVLGSRGRGRMRSALLGSVSGAVAARAECPVVICRPTDEPFAKTALIVGADGSEESLPVIEFAFRQASLRDMPLNVVHCYAEPSTRRWRRAQPVDKEGLRLLLAESVAGMADKFPDVHVWLRLDNDTVAEALNRGQRPWEMVVVGRHPAPPTAHRGPVSTAAAVLERSDSPVAVVPEAGTPGSSTHPPQEEPS